MVFHARAGGEPARYSEPATMPEEDPTTQELRIEQLRREKAERERAERERVGHAPTDEAPEQHERRADKAAYLRERLEERARAEREAAREDRGD